jgi:hypothetical protein
LFWLLRLDICNSIRRWATCQHERGGRPAAAAGAGALLLLTLLTSSLVADGVPGEGGGFWGTASAIWRVSVSRSKSGRSSWADKGIKCIRKGVSLCGN